MSRRAAPVAVGLAVAALAAVGPTAPATAAPARGDVAPTSRLSAPAGSAAAFLTSELNRLGYVYPNPVSFPAGAPDAGLMADAILALHRAGVAPDVQEQATQKLRATYFNAKVTAAGSIGKYLLVAEEQGVDARHWGKDSDGQDIDLVSRLRATQDTDGYYQDTPYNQPSAPSNTFSQSLALLGTHAAGKPLNRGVDALLRQQCPGGGFRLNVPRDRTPCTADAGTSADSTAMGVWALTVVGGSRARVDQALGWLRKHQDEATGGFNSGPQSSVNANSTGLGAMALAMGGDQTAASRATGWLASVQVPASVSVPAMAGAIATGAGDLAAVTGSPATYWYKNAGTAKQADNLAKQDKLRRATAQALLGLTAAPPAATNPGTSRGHGRDSSAGSAHRHSVGGQDASRVTDPQTGVGGPGAAAADQSDVDPQRAKRPATGGDLDLPRTAALPFSARPAAAVTPTTTRDGFWSTPAGIALAGLAGLLLAGASSWLLLRRSARP